MPRHHDYSNPTKKKSVFWHIDVLLLASTVALSVLGVLMIYAVTKPQSIYLGVGTHHFLIRQAIFVVIGIVLMFVTMAIDYRYFEEFGLLVYAGVIFLLLVVLSPIGKNVLGGQRWFQIGPIQLQPSELAIVGLILIVAFICSRRDIENPKIFVLTLVAAGIPIGLVYLQPDLGTAIILGVTLLVMLVLAGVRARYLAVLISILLFAILLVLHFGILKQYQVERLTAFLHPKNAPAATVYSLQQSENAIGSGGFWGKGYGQGLETNLAFVPEQQTDFIFTSVGEQLGFVGTVSVIGVFALMAWRLLRAVMLARDSYGKVIAAGTLGVLSFSVFENIGMTLGIMPITGIPLPFLSYGGTSTVVFFVLVGLVLNIEMRRESSEIGRFTPPE